MFWVELALGGGGSGCGFSKIVFQCYIAPIDRWGGVGWGRQAKQAVVNKEWERGEIVMCIAVPDTSILADINQLIKYSSPSNSHAD